MARRGAQDERTALAAKQVVVKQFSDEARAQVAAKELERLQARVRRRCVCARPLVAPSTARRALVCGCRS